MKLATPKQMKEIDECAINYFGIPGIVLMENAAIKLAEESIETLGDVSGKNILLLTGKGNNGGDAFAAARHFYARGVQVKVWLLARKTDISGDARVNLEILEKIGLQVVELTEKQQLPALSDDVDKAALVIDGIFGTGIKGELKGLVTEVIDMVNRSSRPVVSIDIPSGVDGETGKILGTCIKAVKTVTFCLPKTGLAVHPGCEYTGKLVVADIGIPHHAVDRQNIRVNIIDHRLAAGMVPERPDDSSKGDYGKVLIVTGSAGMTGSGCLCANAALRTGAGLVYVGVPSSLSPIYGAALREPIVLPLDDAGNGRLSGSSAKQISGHLARVDVAAVGPGLSLNDEITEVVNMMIKESRVPLVLDADALNAVSRDIRVLKSLKAEAVVTPHPGEMARLTGSSIEEVQNDRIGAARKFACEWGVITVLKGSRTVVALPEGTVYVNTCGNPGMASAGAGDVLAGVIAGLAGQGVRLADAAVLGVYLHGLAGDAAADKKGQHGMIAGDMVEELPYVIKRLVFGGKHGL